MKHELMIATLLLAGCSGGGSASDNPIIGTWDAVAGSPDSCGRQMTFTADTETDVFADPSQNRTHNVTYNASPELVHTIGQQGDVVDYVFNGRDSMTQKGVRYPCNYQRSGTIAAAAPAPPANPLLGHWTIAEGDPVACFQTLTFTPTQEMNTQPDPSWNQSWDVTYAVEGDLVKVNARGIEAPYRVTGPNTMEWAGTPGKTACKFRRG